MCDIRYLDLGCSNHMTRNIELFSSFDKSVQTKVILGTDIQVIILGKGSINILTKQGEQKFMPNVYDVAGLKHKLMITVKLLQKGYKINLEDNHCVILDRYPRNQLISRIHMTSNRLFPLKLKPTMKRRKIEVISKEIDAQSATAFKA
jgi:hypothetical protein